MRIGILTHHYINNFGAFLQAYALCGAVAELYPDDEVEIINYINKKHFIINTLGWFRYYKNRESFESWMQKIRLPKTFGKARREDMKLSPLCLTVGDINKCNYDCIIIGSDEVWNYKDKKANQKVKFGYGLKCKKLIAYAPSVGKSDAGEELPDYVKEGIKKFDAVSARDSLTAELIERSSGKKAARVLDPTFLYRFPKAELKSAKKPYILFYYCEHMPESIKNYILDYAKKHGFAVYGAGECDKVYTDITVNLSPFEWVEMFRNAEFVFTGTFHGAVFSILNKKQFMVYLTNPSRIKKVGALLKELNIGDRQLNEDFHFDNSSDIDYNAVYLKIEEQKEKSIDYIRKSIG